MRLTRPDRKTVTEWSRGLAVTLAAGLFLALSGAFNAGASMGERLSYWIPLMVGAAFWGTLCARVIGRLIDVEDRPWLQFAVLTVVTASTLTVIIWIFSGFFFYGRMPPLQHLPGFLIPVFAITAIMSGLGVFMSRSPVETHAAAPDAAPSRFLDRLPPRLRGARLFAVQAEDHYLRLHTDRGSDLILMRLSDALAELEGLEGAQTHRSWWVARDAVRDVSRGDGRAVLTLEGGLQAPVSRRYARALRQVGWW